MADEQPEFQDGLVHAPGGGGGVRGRGAGLNPGNRFEDVRLHVLGEHWDEVIAENPGGVKVVTRVYEDRSRTLLNHVESPDIGFEWSINAYRGCEHGCIYCYARPGHEYFGLSSGLDFETKIFAKKSAPELLRTELRKPRWTGEPIMMSGVTDPYQPVEAKLKLTRRILEVMLEHGQPVSLITKNRLITRDLDILSELARHNAARAAVSITSLDNQLSSQMEPRASSPRDRLEAVRQLAAAGVPVAVMVAPIIPGLTDHEMPRILQAAAEAGATGAGYVMLRLPHQVKALFLDWLQRHFPDRADKVESAVRDMRSGELYSSKWFQRQRGLGPRAEQIGAAFTMFSRRYGLDKPSQPLSTDWFQHKRRQHESTRQGPTLFDLD